VASRCSPNWRAISLAGVLLDLGGEVGDKLGSLCQIFGPDVIGLEGGWNAWEPGQRTWVSRGHLWEAPVEDSRHVVCGSKGVAAGGGCQQAPERMFTSFGRQREQIARRVGQAGSAVSPGM
jgi:hypothetical protein